MGRAWAVHFPLVQMKPRTMQLILAVLFPPPATAQKAPLAARRRLVIFMSRAPYPWWPTWGPSHVWMLMKQTM